MGALAFAQAPKLCRGCIPVTFRNDGKLYSLAKPYECVFEKVPFGPETYCETTEEFEAAIRPYMTD
jgi:hypothetical protein